MKADAKDGIKGKASTYIPFITAGGIRLLDAFILPLDDDSSDFTIANNRQSSRRNVPVYYGYSKTGWLPNGCHY